MNLVNLVRAICETFTPEFCVYKPVYVGEPQSPPLKYEITMRT